MAALRSYYPTITSLDGVIEHLNQTPNLSEAQVLYLQEVVKDGQLVLHQSSISVPAEKNSDDDPYFYLVACPIHDAAFNQALNPQDHQYVGYFCDEPQGLRIKVGQKVKVFADYGDEQRHSYEGTVTWISNRSEFTPKTILTDDERADLVYAVKIAIKNDGFVKIGMYGEVKF